MKVLSCWKIHLTTFVGSLQGCCHQELVSKKNPMERSELVLPKSELRIPIEKTDHDRRSCPKLVSGSSSSDAKVGAAVDENLQPSQSTQDREPTMTESFLQEFDFIYGLGV
ncbi:protein FAR1-RELATED SEQUENCE 3-like [Prunus yedoensis var. nudiflora]|uniref:Protein FAR1-RELATED SEQUENCE 3-like n=1 Tax=Prunus yedoensis var. nudiflora TaxID=2094558 RepID=A0A314Y6A6_PRUYE|nr:protein FAR1-RELATED SEQUENCE 3-like [Prunus yedoensis var. nudiflora]